MREIVSLTLLAFVILSINGCNQNHSDNEKYWNERYKAEEKCEGLVESKGYLECLNKVNNQKAESMLETFNPKKEW